MAQRSIERHRGNIGWLYQQEPTRSKKSQREETYLRLFLHGTVGAIAWGYHKAAELSSWRVQKNAKGEWTLTATATRIDPFCLRQTQPTLLFTAPKINGPPWCWPVQDVSYQGTSIRARLGQVEF